MKALVTIIDDNGRIIENNWLVEPTDEKLDTKEGIISTVTYYFEFGVVKCLNDLNERKSRR